MFNTPDGCGLDEEPFQLGEMLTDTIADTQQADTITMVRMEEEQLEVEGADGDSDVGSVPLAEVVDGDEEV